MCSVALISRGELMAKGMEVDSGEGLSSLLDSSAPVEGWGEERRGEKRVPRLGAA